MCFLKFSGCVILDTGPERPAARLDILSKHTRILAILNTDVFQALVGIVSRHAGKVKNNLKLKSQEISN